MSRLNFLRKTVSQTYRRVKRMGGETKLVIVEESFPGHLCEKSNESGRAPILKATTGSQLPKVGGHRYAAGDDKVKIYSQ